MNVAEMIQKLAGTFNIDFVQIIVATVDSVDEAAFTCDCTATSGDANTSIPAVKLNAEANDSFTLIPKVGSTVIIINSTRNDYFVFKVEEIEKIICVVGNQSYTMDATGFVFNDGNFGGMAKTGVVATRLNLIETVLNQLITAVIAINAAGTSLPATPVTNATLQAFLAPILPNPLVLTTQIQISDNLIKH
jgi:hypothetical protein